MPNITELFNCAFASVGDDVPILDATTDTQQKTKLAKIKWPQARDALLRSHPWNCAAKRVTLAPDATPPDWGFENFFTFPSSPNYCLRILECETHQLPWQIEGRKIATSSSELGIRYISRIEPDDFDALLFDAAVDALASELAIPLAGDLKMKQMLYAAVYGEGGKLAWARTIDGQEGRTKVSRNRPLIDARHNRGSGFSSYFVPGLSSGSSGGFGSGGFGP